MIRFGLQFRRMLGAMRLVPALAWLAIQLSMTAMPMHAQAQVQADDPQIAKLFETLGVDRIVLCTPEGSQVFESHDDHVSHEDCRWCQGFGSTLLPEPTRVSVPAVLSGIDPGFPRNSPVLGDTSERACHPSRAPPALI